MTGLRLTCAFLLILVFPVHVFAFVPRAGDTVLVTGQLQDDLYAAGGTVDVTAAIDGDIVAAGGTVTIGGSSSGGVLVAGGNIAIRGSVGRSIRAAGGTLALGGRTGTDAVLAGGNVSVESGAGVGRDLVVAGGKIQVFGSVRRNAFLGGGTVTIAGTIGGNVEAEADKVVLLPTARINGSLRYAADNPVDVQPGAVVSGEVTRLPRRAGSRSMFNPAARLGFRFAGRVLEILWLLVIGFILVAIAPRAVETVKQRVGARFGMSLLAGCLLAIVVPAIVILLLFTLVGIPLAVVALLLYLATLYPGMVFVSAWLGDVISRRFGRAAGSSPYLAVTLGVIALMILVAIPYVGWIFRVLAVLTGFGALWTVLWAARERGGRPATAA